MLRLFHTPERSAAGGPAAAEAARALQLARAVLTELFGPPALRSFVVRFWDGLEDRPALGQPHRFTLVLRRPGALRRMFLPPSEVALAEAYLRGDFDIEGNVEAAMDLAYGLAERFMSPLALARVVPLLRSLDGDEVPRSLDDLHQPALLKFGLPHVRQRDAAAVRYHYDVGNDFYALWLDQRMVYSCAYFQTGTEDLDTAQEAKLDYICRKLRLQPGERLLDIGCGWGGLVLYAAARYGVQALGITLSEPQAALARERIAAAGLSDRCSIEVCDYRDLASTGVFDKAVSVGMVEHVGRSRLPAYFAHAYRLLRPGGLFLNHGIVTISQDPPVGPVGWMLRRLWNPGGFYWKYIFPDGELVTPGQTLQAAETAGFETRDVESLREHYTLTLRHWLARLEGRHDEAVHAASETHYRLWRLYLAGAAWMFTSGQIGVVQALLGKRDSAGRLPLPLTRHDLYGDRPPDSLPSVA